MADNSNNPTTPIQRYNQRKSNLFAERASWLTNWQDLSRVLLPRNGRFLVGDRNRGERRHNAIYDSTATRALRVLAAGLMAGMTSPARPWFKLETADSELMEYEPVKIWITQVTKLMRQIFNRSNTYRSLHMIYEEIGAFGTGATVLLEDFDTVIHHYPLTIGEYAIATNAKGEVDTLFREFDMTVGQMAGFFGYKNLSKAVQRLYDQGNFDKWVTVNHIVQPRDDRDPRRKDARNMPYASCYYENGQDAVNESKFLRESGYKSFPILVPRWACTGGDIYGNSPGMECYGDIKQLQHEQFRKAQGIDYMVKPPLQMPNQMKNVEFNALPGGANFYDGVSSGAIKSAFDVRIDLQHLLGDIQDVRGRINETFYTNLFMMLAMNDQEGKQPITAREVAERHEEKLLMLGPVLERLHNELLKKKIDATFDYMVRADILPPPPREMQGQTLNVEFISMLAQAQRAIGTSSIDRYTMAMGQIAQFKPAVLDKFNEDEWADQYGEMLGIDPQLIVANDKVAIVRDNRAKAQQAAAQQAQLAQGAQTAKTLSETPTGGEQQNALGDVIQQFSGYGGPGAPSAV